MTTNFLQETEDIFSMIDKTWDDIDFIGGDSFSVSVENFREVAARTEYETGYGAPEIATDLVIVFTDGSWLGREEYDGSEWWQYYYCPVKPMKRKLISALSVNESSSEDYLIGWANLENINFGE